MSCLRRLFRSGSATGGQTPSDVTPNTYSFTAQTGAALSTLTTSNSVTPTGYDTASPISIAGGQYQIGAGSWVSSSGTITPGQSVKVRLTSSSSYSTLASCSLTIGGVSAEFDVTTTSAPAPTPTPTVAGPTSFILGAFGQRETWPGTAQFTDTYGDTYSATPAADLHAVWASRGVNTLFGYDTGWGTTLQAYSAHARASGLKYVRLLDSANYATDIADTSLIAAGLRDEPFAVGYDWEGQQVTPWRNAGWTKPICGNLAGRNLIFKQGTDYLDTAGVDWFSQDDYPLQFHDPIGVLLNSSGNGDGWYQYTLEQNARVIDMMFRRGTQGETANSYVTHTSIGKPVFHHVPTGRMNAGIGDTAAPTIYLSRTQFRLFVWAPILVGSAGVVYFPQGLSKNATVPFADDVTAQGPLLPEIALFHADIAFLQALPEGNVLMDTTNGGRRAFTPLFGKNTTNADPYNTALGSVTTSGNQISATNLPFPFSGMTVVCGGETFRFILNNMDTTAVYPTGDYDPFGLAGVSFQAHAIRCYRASAPTTNILPSAL